MLWGGFFCVIIALVMPWLGSSKTQGKAMVDYMSYPEAILYILLVFGFMMVCFYFMLFPKIKKDIRENLKVIWKTTITDKGKRKYSSKNARRAGYFVIIVQESPFRSKDIVVTASEYQNYLVDDSVTIEYTPHSKKMMNMYKSS